MILDEVKKQKNFVIYGAQVVAYGAYVAISKLTGLVPEAFIVSCPDNNPHEIEGIPVYEVGWLKEKRKEEISVLVAVTELVLKDILPFLKEMGFSKVFALTWQEEFLLMSSYFEKFYGYRMAKNGNNSGRPDFVCYEVSNHRDTPLKYHPELKEFERPIQAGKALTEKCIASTTDNTGVNISDKNKQYCEMSAVYWIWKNTNHDWKGIEHYRRHILVSPLMLSDDVDVVIPLPYICYPNTMAQFRRFVSEEVMQALFRALKEIHPDRFAEYEKILYGNLQYTYNIVCARREVFDAYCEWFFRITERMETFCEEVPEIKETRALSYVAEVLTNLYFMYNQKALNIVHAPREIYV